MNTASTIRVSATAMLLAAAFAGRAELIDFEGVTGGAPQSGGTYLTYATPLVVGDYSFTTPSRFNIPPEFGVWTDIANANTSFSNYTGSVALFSNSAAPSTMTHTGGGLFDVLSIDVANIYRNSTVGTTVRFTGNFSGGGTVVQDYAIPAGTPLHTVALSGFVGLTSFVLSDPSSGDALNPYQFDNINVQAVPEPATMAMFGLGALATLRRRRAR